MHIFVANFIYKTDIQDLRNHSEADDGKHWLCWQLTEALDCKLRLIEQPLPP